MATFPTLPHTPDSERSGDDGFVVDKAEDGVVRVRAMFASTVYEFSLRLGPLTDLEKASLFSHYDADKVSEFSYTWPGDNIIYTVVYTERPKIKESESWGHWDAEVSLSGKLA